MQLLNIALGGGIDQHLEDPDRVHRDDPGKFVAIRVEVVAGTKLETIMGPGESGVRSHHHQGIEPLAPRAQGPRALARRPGRGRRGDRLRRRSAWRCCGTRRRTSPAAARASTTRCSSERPRGRVRRHESCATARPWMRSSPASISRSPTARVEPARPNELRPPPGKIVATHLSYRSRCDEYAMDAPPPTSPPTSSSRRARSPATAPRSLARAAAASSTTRARSRS